MLFTLAFSPCPNDTFIFDALVNHKIDTEGIDFKVSLEDVETLNNNAISNQYDISKISYGAYHKILNDYIILDSGSALGTGVGPLLISKEKKYHEDVNQETIAIPGENTTAHFLFSMAFPNAKNKVFLRYDDIEAFVKEGKGLGEIIHENRFTYHKKGLHKIIDLGDYWEKITKDPIPLGGIVMRRNIEKPNQQKINRLIQKSIAYAYSFYPELNEYIRNNSQEMTDAVMHQHIELYVNDYSKTLGPKGREAVLKMLEVFNVDVATASEDYFFVG